MATASNTGKTTKKHNRAPAMPSEIPVSSRMGCLLICTSWDPEPLSPRSLASRRPA
jgi:hypothetical protein